jgi:uncharacterized membrane protein (UPF0127 family)
MAMRKRLLALGALAFGALSLASVFNESARSAEGNFVYSKAVIKIIPAARQSAEGKEDSAKAATASTPHLFTVAIRDIAFLDQKDFVASFALSGQNGLLLPVAAEETPPLQAKSLLTPVDVLFVAPDGAIAEIAPSLSLARLEEPLIPHEKLRAYLLLKAGTAAEMGIKPGDYVQHSLFRRRPVVLQ